MLKKKHKKLQTLYVQAGTRAQNYQRLVLLINLKKNEKGEFHFFPDRLIER